MLEKSKPPSCLSEHWLFVLPGQGKAGASLKPCNTLASDVPEEAGSRQLTVAAAVAAKARIERVFFMVMVVCTWMYGNWDMMCYSVYLDSECVGFSVQQARASRGVL